LPEQVVTFFGAGWRWMALDVVSRHLLTLSQHSLSLDGAFWNQCATSRHATPRNDSRRHKMPRTAKQRQLVTKNAKKRYASPP
jgi:hypothetical protein